MSGMIDSALEAHILQWLRSDTALSGRLPIIDRQARRMAETPYAVLAINLVRDWSSKGQEGQQVALAITAADHGDTPAALRDAVGLVLDRLALLPSEFPGGRIITATLVSRRIAPDSGEQGLWRARLDYRIRLTCGAEG